MTEKELSKYYYLNIEIKDLEEKIARFGDGVGSPGYGEMIKSSGRHDSIEEKYVQLKSMYMEARVSALEEYIKIEKYISSVEDPEIRLILRKRFLDLKQWEEIGNELYCDRTTVSKKCRNFIKNQVSHKSHVDLIK
jgi:hypothetical protein